MESVFEGDVGESTVSVLCADDTSACICITVGAGREGAGVMVGLVELLAVSSMPIGEYRFWEYR
jgi:hypothetical protein